MDLDLLKQFFYDYGKMDTHSYNNVLMFLYGAKNEIELIKKFKSEFTSLNERYNNDIKENELLIKELEKVEEDTDLIRLLKGANSDIISRKIENTDMLTMNDIVRRLKQEHENNLKYYDDYLNALNSSLKAKNLEVKYIVVYEAPPFAGKYILGQTKSNLPEITTYWSPIKAVISSLKEYKYNNEDSPTENLVINGIGFIDLSLVPLPLKEMRKKWSVDPSFNVNGIQLPVHLFEWAMDHFIKGIECQIINSPLIAIGIPNNTSISIFDYYAYEKDGYTYNHCGKSINISVSEPNFPKIKSEFPGLLNELNGRTLRLHKNNVNGGLGYPNGSLMKMAFNISRIPEI